MSTLRRKKRIEDLSIEEIRQLLVEKRRAERELRLERFRRTGRVVRIEPQPSASAFQTIQPLDKADSAFDDTLTPHKSNRWLDRLLLLVEIAAVIGLAFVLLNGMNLIRSLNEEVAAALVQPTLTPTPLIQAVVLPSGHTPPNSPGGVRPNDAEIPEHLRPLVQTFASLPIPTPSPEQAIRIQIPAIGVDAPVVQGDGWEQLKKGVGTMIGSPNPGQKGNLVLSAHNDVFGEIFRDLDQLKKGDEIILYTSQRAFVYVVEQSQIVEPTRVEVLAPTREAVVTLISCYPYMVNTHRIVVRANFVEQK